MLITKQDLIDRTRISAQLSDKQVIPFIQDAEEYDLPKVLPGTLIAEVQVLNLTATPWTPEAAFLAGSYSLHGNIYYKALSDTTGLVPGTDATIWQADYKATLRYLYLPDFLIWSAYYRLLLEHGRNITEAGLTVPSDPQGTYQQGSDKARAELMASARDKASRHRDKITAFLSKYNLITRNSCEPTRRRGSGRITAI